ncbi:large ribosomal subunit protein mL50-like isoform X2 [Heptranchias perlo]|uniref:large ribosomal subunit protein mL50-like isoform X2 n=1 Tax=Heptranchias perlo TaxID=212740 RepID=UPI00355A2839
MAAASIVRLRRSLCLCLGPSLGRSLCLGPSLGRSLCLGPSLGRSLCLGPSLGRSLCLGPSLRRSLCLGPSLGRSLSLGPSLSLSSPQNGTEEVPSLAVPPVRSRSYRPPADLEAAVRAAAERAAGPSPPAPPGDWTERRPPEEERFRLLRALEDRLGHAVPNSQLHRMRSPGDLLRYYRRPAGPDASAYRELSRTELPPNLRVRWGYGPGPA